MKIHNINIRVTVPSHRHNDLVPIRGKTRCKCHSWKITKHLLLAGINVVDVDSWLIIEVREIGYFLQGRRKPWSKRHMPTISQISMVFTILIHKSKLLHPVVGGTRLCDINNPSIEITSLSSYPSIQFVGNKMSHPAPVCLRCL